MSQAAFEALTAARLAGCDIGLDEGGLFCDFESDPPETVLAGIREQRAEIVRLLTPGPDGRTGEAWWSLLREFRDHAERDGMSEFGACEVAYQGLLTWLPEGPEAAVAGLAELGITRPVARVRLRKAA